MHRIGGFEWGREYLDVMRGVIRGCGWRASWGRVRLFDLFGKCATSGNILGPRGRVGEGMMGVTKMGGGWNG